MHNRLSQLKLSASKKRNNGFVLRMIMMMSFICLRMSPTIPPEIAFCPSLLKLMRLKLDLDPADDMYDNPHFNGCGYTADRWRLTCMRLSETLAPDSLRNRHITWSKSASARPPLPRRSARTPSVVTPTCGDGLTQLRVSTSTKRDLPLRHPRPLPAASTRPPARTMTSMVAMPSPRPSISMPGAMAVELPN